MHWTYRAGTVSDIATCLPLLEPFRGIYGQSGWTCLGDFLRFLMKHEAIDFAIAHGGEQRDAPIVAFDTFIFVAESFVEDLLTEPPYVIRTVLKRFQEDQLPVLTPRSAYQAHSTVGLNVVHLLAWINFDLLMPTQTHLMLDRHIDDFYRRLRGLRTRRILSDAYGPVPVQWLQSAGFSVFNDHSEYYRAHPDEIPPDDVRPTLMTVTADDAQRDFGSRASPAFRFTPPRLGFSPSEQAMLQFALAGQTDEELAEALDISVWTVKKRWRQIYDRVVESLPALLSGGQRFPLEEGKGRGVEHRRHLLAYLREHAEELCTVEQWRKRGPDGETLRVHRDAC